MGIGKEVGYLRSRAIRFERCWNLLTAEVDVPSATRMTKSLSLDRAIFKEVQRTRGSGSTSERVNNLLRVGLEAERKRSLHKEAAAFFEQENSDQSLHDAFHQAALETWTRGGD